MIARAMTAVGVALLLLLSGCSAPPAEQSAPAPTVQPEPNSGPVGMQSSALQPVREAVPPVRVQVPSVGIDVSVQPVGVQPDGLMELPANVAIAGWYRYGPDPESATGTTVIAAHVDSLEFGLGPFAKLKGLPAGTVVVVTTADGTVHNYTISSVQNVLKEQLPLGDVFDRDGERRLVLITCGGQFNYETLHYSDNVVAVATPAQL